MSQAAPPLPQGVTVEHDLDGLKITLLPPPGGARKLGMLVAVLSVALLVSVVLLGISAALLVVGVVVAAVAFIRQLSHGWLIGPRVVLVQPAALVVSSIRVPWGQVAQVSEDAIITLRDGETVSVAAGADAATRSWLAVQLRAAHGAARHGEPSAVPAALRALTER